MENLHRDKILRNINNLMYQYMVDAAKYWDRPPTGELQSKRVRDLSDRITAYIGQYIICESDEVN